MATRTWPGVSGADATSSSRNLSGVPSSRQPTALAISSRARLAPRQRFADERQPVVAEIHVRLVDKDGRRAEAAARHHLVGIFLQLILDRLIGDALEERCRFDADALANFREHRVLRDILVLAPV